MTRFEQFKQTSIEEVAENIRTNGTCDMCANDKHSCTVENEEACRAYIIAWLNQELPEPPKPMTINEYQKLAMRTDNKNMEWRDALLDSVLGLGGESGECEDVVKKYCFQHHELNRKHLIEELGDVAWYLAKCATVLGMNLEDILRANIQKLEGRYPDGFEVDRSVNR